MLKVGCRGYWVNIFLTSGIFFCQLCSWGKTLLIMGRRSLGFQAAHQHIDSAYPDTHRYYKNRKGPGKE
jgi:hypothetical protein